MHNRIGLWCCGAITLTVSIALIMQYLPFTSTPEHDELITNNSSISVSNIDVGSAIARTPDYSSALFEEAIQTSATTTAASDLLIETIFVEPTEVEEIPPGRDTASSCMGNNRCQKR
jgi:hypothetical protein